jgi:hypothetical protein
LDNVRRTDRVGSGGVRGSSLASNTKQICKENQGQTLDPCVNVSDNGKKPHNRFKITSGEFRFMLLRSGSRLRQVLIFLNVICLTCLLC